MEANRLTNNWYSDRWIHVIIETGFQIRRVIALKRLKGIIIDISWLARCAALKRKKQEQNYKRKIRKKKKMKTKQKQTEKGANVPEKHYCTIRTNRNTSYTNNSESELR